MEESPQDRAFLESLTSDALVKLADNHGIDIPPGLDRAIVIEELLETLNDNDTAEEIHPVPLEEKSQAASVPIPKQYNITFVEVLIRDPLWAFAFWEINTHDKTLYELDPNFSGYFLKVFPCSTLPSGADSSFSIPVGNEDTAWYLGFPPGGGTFKVELSAVFGEKRAVLAVSKRFRLPKLLGVRLLEAQIPEARLPEVQIQGVSALSPEEKEETLPVITPLLQLSGVDELTILRNTQRLSRVPRRGGVQG
jgi:hypothetical protein